MILINGDSWTNGLAYENVSDYWSFKMASKHNLHITNLAVRGSSNQRIFRTTFEALQDLTESPSHLIIGWSFFSRFELPHKEGHYIRVSPNIIPYFHETGENVENIGSINTLFYKYLHNTDLMYDSFLTNFSVLQTICHYRNIRLLCFNSAEVHERLLNNPILAKAEWIIPPDDSMGKYLDRQGFERIKSGHTSADGQSFWAEFVYNKL